MLETLERTIETRALWKRGAKIILGVSGGADSMAMLHALASLRDEWNLKLRVAHVHHGLRGRAADADARLVEKTSRKLGIPFHTIRADVKKISTNKKISVEMAAREARHDFFRKLAKKYRAVVATAHTRDDQAETVLLRLLRGSGADGLGGIEYKTKVRGLPLVRPMLDVSHETAVNFLRARKLKWREDASNDDEAMKRNRVRHELLPLLERKFNPRIRDVLARTAALLRADSEFLVRLSGAELKSRIDRGGSLRHRDPPDAAIWRRVLYRWLLCRAGVTPDRLDFDLVSRVEALALRGGAITLPGNIALRSDHERLFFRRARTTTPVPKPARKKKSA
jgi:tRNA(Ile)-lysidine synthase